jgi:hypothetical protein
MWGLDCGKYGVPCYQKKEDGIDQVGGIDLEALLNLDKPLGDGTELEVSVRVIKKGKRLKTNPWLKETSKFIRKTKKRK